MFQPKVLDAVLLLATWAVTYVGFACLALAMERHWFDVMRASAIPRRVVRQLRLLGGTCIGLGLALAVLRDGLGFGGLHWVMSSTAAAMGVALTLAWTPTLLRPLARGISGPGRAIGPGRADDVRQ